MSINQDIADILNADATVRLEDAESPIEAMLLAALVDCGFNTDAREATRSLATLYQQHPVTVDGRNYRLDFAVVRHVGRHAVKVAIEVDGAFHVATKEQVTKDNRRTRALAKAGWVTVRYSGSEVFRDARACALDVAGIVIESIDRLKGGK